MTSEKGDEQGFPYSYGLLNQAIATEDNISQV